MSDASSSALPAFVRGMRTLLIVQLAVAVLALAATGWAMWKLPTLTAEVVELNRQIEENAAENERLTTEQGVLTTRIQQTTRAARLLTDGLMVGARGDWNDAIPLIQQAQATDPENPLFLRELAEAEYRGQRFDDAVTHIREARAKSGSEVVLPDFTQEAIYACAAGRPQQAEQTLRDPVFLAAARANPALVLENRALMAACPGTSRPYFVQLVGGVESGGPAADPTVFKIRTVYLHIVRPEDRENARHLRTALREAGYSVPPIVEVDASRFVANVRYYYGAQGDEAAAISAIVQTAAEQNRIAGWSTTRLRTINLEGRYQGLPTGTAEVWLPPTQ